MKKVAPILLLIFAFPSLACRLISAVEESALPTTDPGIILPTPLNPPPTLVSAITSTPEASPTPASTTTIDPSTTPCTYRTAFIADVTIPDDTTILPGASFSKTWRIRNNGSCPLPEGTNWSYANGERMNGPISQPLAPLAAGETADITIQLIAPQNPGTHTGYWQVVLPNGVTLATRYYVRIIVPSPTTAPTATPTTAPTPVPTVTNAPSVIFFRANVTLANPGDTIQLEWDTLNSDSVAISRIINFSLTLPWNNGPRGTMSFTIPASERNSISFALYPLRQGYTGPNDGVALTVRLTCPNPWFFTPAPAECAAQNAIISAGAEQPFEHGVMIWIQELDMIYVLYDGPDADGEWASFVDNWNVGDPIDDPSLVPPTGLYQPLRGFGLVWRESFRVRERLGWATAPETGFNTAYQTTARFKYNEAFIRALDGKVWRLLAERSGWEKLIVQTGN